MKKAYILVKDEEQKQKVLDTIFKHPDTLDLAIEIVIDTPENREAIEKLADEEYKIQT